MLAGSLLPFFKRVAFGAHVHRIPWVERVVHVEVIVVTGNRHDEMGADILDEFHESIRIPFLSLEHGNEILIPKFRVVAIALVVPVGQTLDGLGVL